MMEESKVKGRKVYVQLSTKNEKLKRKSKKIYSTIKTKKLVI